MLHEPVQQHIDELAERLQRSVVIDDPEVRLLWASRHFGDEDEVRTHAVLQRRASSAAIGHVLAQGVSAWTTPGVIPPEPSIGMHARVCYPIRWRGELLGLLLVVDADGTVTTAELSAIKATGEQVAPLLAAQRTAEEGDAGGEMEAAVLDLLGDTPMLRLAALRGLSAARDLAGFHHVRVVQLRVDPSPDGTDAHIRSALRFALDQRGTELSRFACLVAVHERGGTVVLGSSRPITESYAADLAARLLARVDEVGSEGPGLERAWASYDQATLACRAAARGRERVGSWATLGPDAVLLHLPAELSHDSLPAELQRVLAADKDGRLLETLRVFLDHAGVIPATAAALHVHRTTLYYRLDKLGELAGVDLGDGDTRLALHLGIKLLDGGFLRQS
jgi:hypothetical protein